MAASTVTFAAPKYPPPAVSSVAEMLDPSRPLVKSTLPLTKPLAPRFVDPSEAERRRQMRQEKKQTITGETSKIYTQRLNERKFLKAQYEFDREKRLAERTIYRKEKQDEWKHRFSNSPFHVDLVADSERIEEEVHVRSAEETRKKGVQEARKKQVKNDVIIKALSEAPQLDAERTLRRQNFDAERRDKALKDVKRVDAIFERKLMDQDQLERERKEKLELQALQTRSQKRF
jgi:hypothetical protein